jgi:hypothetical protein
MRKKIIGLCAIGILLCSGTISISATDVSNDLLIITPDDFSSALVPLVEHKQQHGIMSMIVSLTDIYTSVYFEVQGRDASEQIKYFIKDAVEQWGVKYVMLVGGKEHMPVRYSVINLNSSLEQGYDSLFPGISPVRSDGFITDLYYADIYDQDGGFCSWDSNNNSVFGEIGPEDAIDDVDLYPDICVGRILCKTSEEVQTVVNKIIEYENTAFGQEWFTNVILCGGDTHPYTWEEILLCLAFKNITGRRYRGAWEGEYMGDQVAKILSSFTAKKLYTSGLLGVRAKRLTTKNINQAINDGAGFLLFSMHGSPTKIVTYPPFNKKRWLQVPLPSGYDISEVQKLINGGKLPIAVFSACSNGDFDTLPSPIAWEFVNHSTGGAIASFALTTEGNIYPTTMYTETLSGHTTMSVFKAYADGVNVLGEIWAQTITRYLDDEVAWSVSEHFISDDGQSMNWLNLLALEEWILFGDPSLKIGGYEP